MFPDLLHLEVVVGTDNNQASLVWLQTHVEREGDIFKRWRDSSQQLVLQKVWEKALGCVEFHGNSSVGFRVDCYFDSCRIHTFQPVFLNYTNLEKGSQFTIPYGGLLAPKKVLLHTYTIVSWLLDINTCIPQNGRFPSYSPVQLK